MKDNNLKAVKSNETLSYRERVKESAKKPSFSKQFSAWLETKNEDNASISEKRLYIAITESQKAGKISIKDVAEYIASRYDIIDFREKFASPYYLGQYFDKKLRAIMLDSTTAENLRNCIARYFRAVICENKKDGAILYNSTQETQETQEQTKK